MTATAWMAGDGPGGLSWRAWLLVLLIAVAALFPGITAIPVMDRDEGRYLQATKQMMETGDYVDIRLQEATRYGYPAGTYWVKAAGAHLFGGVDAPVWAYRLPSFVAGVIAVLATAWIGARIGGPAAGVAAGLLLATSLVVAVESRTARSDALLLATVVVAQAALYRLTKLSEDRPAFWGAPLVFWLAHGVGVLIKGPLITLVVGLTIVALCLWRRDRVLLRRLRFLPGIGLTLALVLPWLTAITMKVGSAYIEEAIGRSLMGKVATGDRAHGAPPGYHLVALFVAFWPGALLAGAAAALAWTRRREDDIRFLICWFVPTFLVFEVVATKLPHYTMPTYPALAVMVGMVLSTGFRPEGRWRWAHRVTVGLFVVVTLALTLVPTVGAMISSGWGSSLIHTLTGREFPRYTGDWVDTAPWASLVGLVALAAGYWTLRRLAVERSLVLVGSVVIFFGVTFHTVLPALDMLWPSRALAHAVGGLSGCEHKPVAITGYAEPSAVFYLGTDTGLGDPADAVELLRANPECGIAVTADRDEQKFLAVAAAAGVGVKQLGGPISAFNYTRGKPVRLTVFLADGTKLHPE
ncbi:glycosyltransferase family 39 protein [Thalassobaculum sp.]|uniref:ArnT family glycosyltransferase n=1 Tax=Thalassobaculum sp. TaxID=2022740 RepID=UPI0032EB9982